MRNRRVNGHTDYPGPCPVLQRAGVRSWRDQLAPFERRLIPQASPALRAAALSGDVDVPPEISTLDPAPLSSLQARNPANDLWCRPDAVVAPDAVRSRGQERRWAGGGRARRI